MRRNTSSTLVIAFALAACSKDRTEPLGPGVTKRGLIAHEWGTYTSLQGSDGRSMNGLHHAEHLLPAFVKARLDRNPDQKGIESLPEPVNQKLETPVIYFYDADPKPVAVRVRFPEGIISEWYPGAVDMAPPVDEMRRMAGGEMTWRVELVPDVTPPEVPSDSIWAPSRRTKSLGVRYVDPLHVDLPDGYHSEKFIFYRGLGRFDRPVRVTSELSRGPAMITVHNDSNVTIPSAFLLDFDGEVGSVLDIGAIEGGGSEIIVNRGTREPVAAYLDRAKKVVATALEATGLYADEAQAMVDTWESSYFTSAGVRVLYVAPRAWVDELLPLEMEPRPTELVRTLVGRIEVMTVDEEYDVVRTVEEAAKNGGSIASDRYGRFTEPKLRRAAELIDDPAAKAWCESLAAALATLP
jgi:hypothetical protein